MLSPLFIFSSLFSHFSAIAFEYGFSHPIQKPIHSEFPLQNSRMFLMMESTCSTQFHAIPPTWGTLSLEDPVSLEGASSCICHLQDDKYHLGCCQIHRATAPLTRGTQHSHTRHRRSNRPRFDQPCSVFRPHGPSRYQICP